MPSRKLVLVLTMTVLTAVTAVAQAGELSPIVPQAPTPLPQLRIADTEEDIGISPSDVPVLSPKTLSFPPPPGASRVGQYKGVAKAKAPEQRVPVKSSIGLTADDEPVKKFTAGDVMEPPMNILPEVTTAINLSSSDLNRIICTSGEVKEALTSDEKGLMIKITGKDVFVKYKVAKKSDGKLSYATTPTELYVVCGENTYSMIAFPDRRPSTTIRLSTGIDERAQKNHALYEGLPFEKRMLRLIKEAYTDALPDSYLVKQRKNVITSFKKLNIALKREVEVEGEGLRLKEYHLTLKPGASAMKLEGKMFLRTEFTDNAVAVSLDSENLRSGQTIRLFIVEQRADQPLGGLGGFMSMEGSNHAALSVSTEEGPKPQVPSHMKTRNGASAGGVK